MADDEVLFLYDGRARWLPDHPVGGAGAAPHGGADAGWLVPVLPNGDGATKCERVFQTIFERPLEDCRFVDALAYPDDVNAATDTAAELVVPVDKILSRMEEEELKLKLRKCRFGQRSIETLGFRVANGTLAPSDSHKAGTAAFRIPTDG
jgi:hypothetical protein